jgi:hypothetical protein
MLSGANSGSFAYGGNNTNFSSNSYLSLSNVFV